MSSFSALPGRPAARPWSPQRKLGNVHGKPPKQLIWARARKERRPRARCPRTTWVGGNASLAPASCVCSHKLALWWSLLLPTLRAPRASALEAKWPPGTLQRLAVATRGRRTPEAEAAKRENGIWPPKPAAPRRAALRGCWRRHAAVPSSQPAPNCHCRVAWRWGHAIHCGIAGQRRSGCGRQSSP